MLKTGDWQNVEFSELNFNSSGAKIQAGHEHPLLKVWYEFRQIFLAMGFEEMDTHRWVESSFWNFDTLFQGQQHPCRDMHDTFFIGRPALAHPISDGAYFQRVKQTHESGGFGSIGLRYSFDDQVPLMNILRTHTTAISSHYLKTLADQIKKTCLLRPRRFFSIDRVYRNEMLDSTHLAEFHQVEGFVIDRNLSIGDLMSYVNDFFGRIGLHDIEYKPAYNPYTEPSMEIFAKHPVKGWMEIGNSGIFRPEMLEPMGLPPEWTVVAWGFSLERPTMIEYAIDDIRSLEGPNVSFDLMENASIPRLAF
jgi:phenylalanyl-tRNA synthetase alpha chain